MACWRDFSPAIKNRVFYYIYPALSDYIVNDYHDATKIYDEPEAFANPSSFSTATPFSRSLLLISKSFSEDQRYALEAHLRSSRNLQAALSDYKDYHDYVLHNYPSLRDALFHGDAVKSHIFWQRRSAHRHFVLEKMLRCIEYFQILASCWTDLPRELVHQITCTTVQKCVSDYESFGYLVSSVQNWKGHSISEAMREEYLRERMASIVNMVLVSRDNVKSIISIINDHEAELREWWMKVDQRHADRLDEPLGEPLDGDEYDGESSKLMEEMAQLSRDIYSAREHVHQLYHDLLAMLHPHSVEAREYTEVLRRGRHSLVDDFQSWGSKFPLDPFQSHLLFECGYSANRDHADVRSAEVVQA